MNKYISLTKTLVSSIAMSKPQDHRRKIITTVFTVFAVCFIMIPAAFLGGFFVKVATEILDGMGCTTVALQLMFHILSLFTVVFGFNVMLNELYFSSDIEFLLPWPLKARQIVASKFTAAYIGENIMQFIFVASSIVGFALGAGLSVGGTIFSVIGIFTMSLLPMAYCGILAMIVMCFTRIFRSRDVIQKITMILIFAVLIGILIGAVSLMDVDFEQVIVQLASGDRTFFSVMDIIFPNVPLLIESIHNSNPLAFLGFLLVNAAAVAVLLLLAEAVYLKGVIRLSSLPEKKKSRSLDSLLKKSSQRSIGLAYFMKEIRVLVRSPMYFTHCVIVNFIWPVFAYAVYNLLPVRYSIDEMKAMYMQNENVGFLFGAVLVIGITMLVSSLGSIGSNAISREGKHFPFMKYIPVPYKIQWNAKGLAGVVFTVAGVLVFAVPFMIILGLPATHILMYIILCVLSAVFVSYLGVYMDSIQPKLVWDYEFSVLRENYNMFFSMAIAIGLVALMCVGGFFLFRDSGLSFGLLSLIYGGMLLLLNGLAFFLLHRSAGRNIAEQEEM